MSASQARSITTNQTSVHEDLMKVLVKHQYSDFKRPIATHTKLAFDQVMEWLAQWQGEVILDACCGVGESTRNIAKQFPNTKVIGIDKSIVRLDKHKSCVEARNTGGNAASHDSKTPAYLLIQADLNDFWRLLLSHIEDQKPSWKITKQFILYPNPYPKKAQLGKRWYGSALFPFIVKVCPSIEIRSNWELYVQECAIAAQFYGLHTRTDTIGPDQHGSADTPFERKYLNANQTCFKLVIRP